MKYIIFNVVHEILRTVQCPPAFAKTQKHEGEFIMRGEADDVTQKIEFDSLNIKGQPVNPRVVDKTPEELTIETSIEPRLAVITEVQWRDVLERLEALGG